MGGLPAAAWMAAVVVLAVAAIFYTRTRQKVATRTAAQSAVTQPAATEQPMVHVTAGALVRSGITTTTVTMHDFTTVLDATGVLQIPDPAQRTITARARGRIERLYVSSTGSFVTRGAPLYDFYSPDIANAEREYLIVRGGQTHVHGSQESEHAAHLGAQGGNDLADAARKRLSVLGLSDAQIAALDHSGTVTNTITATAPQSGIILQKMVQEGAYVEEGTALMQLADLSSVWAAIDVPETYIRFIRTGQAVQLMTPAYPDRRYIGKVIFVSPVEDPASRTIAVRAVFSNDGLRLRPGMAFTATFEINMGRTLAVPASAVLRTGDGDFVWVEKEPGLFESRSIALGERSPDNFYQVKSGLTRDDKVAVTGAFLIDAEHAFQKNNPMATMNMSAGDQGAKTSGVGHGTVRSIDMQSQMITLDHGNIPGVMSAMTMPFKVADPGMLQRVKVSEHVRFVLTQSETGEYVITSIEKE
jgi:Cu(I)/Ag(I) efflux system membrane fusion protein